MLNILDHKLTKNSTYYLVGLLSLFLIRSLPALYMLDVHIENVHDVHVSAVIVAIKKLLPNYKIAVAVNTQASLTSTATSFLVHQKILLVHLFFRIVQLRLSSIVFIVW